MQSQPVAINVALGGVLSTGVTLAALLWPGLDAAIQVAVIAFGNSLIALLVWYLSQRVVTPTGAPRLEEGTNVTILRNGQPTEEKVKVEGPIGTMAKADVERRISPSGW
jgi:hypothetical protein